MKILMLLAVGVLGCSLAGAVTMSKCDLKEQLMKAIKTLPESIQQSLGVNTTGLTSNDFVAKIVCHVELESKFNTSAVTEMSHGQGQSPEVGNSGGSHEGSSGGHQRRHRTAPGQMSGEEADKDLTLYGLFQLCDLVCNEGTADSTNLCNIKCSKLTDDNIDDDISCVLNLFTEILQNGFQSQNLSELRKVIRLIMSDNCKNVKADFYFAEC